MMIFIRAGSIFVICWIFAFACFAGKSKLKPEEEFLNYKSEYPNDNAVYILRKHDAYYDIINDSIVIRIDIHEELMHLGDNTVRHAAEKVFSSSFTQISNLKAYTLIPGKKKYSRIDVVNFKESYDKNSSVFYDDSKAISFTFPSIQKGAKTVLHYTKTIKDPRLMHLFFFDTFIPVAKANYSVNYDGAVIIKSQLFNNEHLTVDIAKNELENSRKQISFEAGNIKKLEYDNNCPSYRNLAASVYCPPISYKKADGNIIELNSSIDQLHVWYRTFVKDILNKDEGLKKLAKSMVEPDDEVLEKVKKVYYWVQANIKYIAFEDGMRGFVPHNGKYVTEKKYGDCKDMASTIVSLLRELDIDAYYTWVGTRDLPYKYSEVPDPITDNHMIATFIHDGITYYLDATGQYSPIHLPTSMIQGKECLISFNESEYKIQEVPIIPKEINIMTDSVTISLKDGNITGHGKATLSGYAKVFNTYKLIKATQKNVDDYVKRLLTKGSNKFQMNEYQLSNVNDHVSTIDIDYEFSISDYYKQIGDKIYLNPILDKTMTDGLLEDRKVALENEYKYINRNIVRLKIPEGFKVETLPNSESNSNNDFGFKISYEHGKNEIVVTKEFYLDFLTLSPNQFEDWNSLINEYAKACRKAIILSR